MSQLFQKTLQWSSPLLAATLIFSGSTQAIPPDNVGSTLEEIRRYTNEGRNNLGADVQGAAKFRDVSPGDWAYQALDDLVKRYDCLVGYPNGTFRGNRPLSRFEFAAGLNACLNQIERLIAAATADFVTKDDLDKIRRLLQDFEAELLALGTRVDSLEARTAFLEDHQFSTTTKLVGEVSMGVTSLFSGDTAAGQEITRNTAFGARSRLNFFTSFTGEDLLHIRLQAEGLSDFEKGTFEGTLGIAGGSGNNVEVDALNYQFTIADNTFVFVAANASTANDFANTITPLDGEDGATAAPSNFATRNSIYNTVDGAGIGIEHAFSDAIALSVGYLAGDASNPGPGSGLFNGPYGIFGQLALTPTENLAIAFAYANTYNADLGVGSNRANLRSALADTDASLLPTALQGFAGQNLPVTSNTYSILASYQLTPNVALGGWVAYTNTRTLAAISDGAGNVLERGDLDIWNWAVQLGITDLGKEGSLAGFVFGMEPKVTAASSNISGVIGTDNSTSYHIEGFYEYPVNDYISITPAVIWLTAPDHNSSNDDVVLGLIRATFNF